MATMGESADKKKSSFRWKISNFSRLELKFNRRAGVYEWDDGCLAYDCYNRSEDIYESQVFSSDPDDLKWSLVMLSFVDKYIPFPENEFSDKGKSDNRKPQLYFEFRNKDSRPFSIDVNLTISLLRHDQKKISFAKKFNLSRRSGEISHSCGKIIPTHKDLDWLRTNKFLENDELQILCEYELKIKK